jgi:shikimate kinase
VQYGKFATWNFAGERGMESGMGNIVLVGFMGTGKSTVAEALARRLGWTKIDLDAKIEEEEGKTISQIFAEHGEPYFRQAETAMLRKALEGQTGQIIATGGGAVLAEENRRLMLKHAFVVALTADEQTIVQRVKDDPNRPLLQGDVARRVRLLMEQRKDAYRFAPVQIDTTDKEVDEIADIIIERWRSARGGRA